MEESVSAKMLEAYEPRFREVFKYHPKRDEIVPKLVSGELDPISVDLYFAQAEHYSFKAFMMNTPPPDEDGYITIEVK